MVARLCPACRKPLENNVTPSGECMSCGHDLAATAPPPGWKRSGADLRLVAKRQRTLLWFVLALVALNLIMIFILGPTRGFAGLFAGQAFVMLVIQIAALVTILQLLGALGVHVAWRVVYAVLMLAPCVNILVLLSVNSQATAALKAAGLKVGIMGVRDEQVMRVLSPNRCTACGYMLSGNMSGVCPECGEPFQT